METFDPKDLYIGEKASFPETKIGTPVKPQAIGQSNNPLPSGGFEANAKDLFISAAPADPETISSLKGFGRAAPTGLAGLGGAVAGAELGALGGSLLGPVGSVVGGFGGGVLGAFGLSAGTGAAVNWAFPKSQSEKVGEIVNPKAHGVGSFAGSMIGFKPDFGRVIGMLEGNSQAYVDALKGAGNMYGFASGTRLTEELAKSKEEGGARGLGNLLEASFFPKEDRLAGLHDAAMGAFVKSNALGHAFESVGSKAVRAPVEWALRPRTPSDVQAGLVSEAAQAQQAAPAQAVPPARNAQSDLTAEAAAAAPVVQPANAPIPVGPDGIPVATQGQIAAQRPAQPAAPQPTPAAPAPAQVPAAAAQAPVGKPTVEPGTRSAVSVAADGRGVVEHIPAHIPEHENLDAQSLVLAHGAMEPAQAVNSLVALNAEAHRRSGGRKPNDPAFKEKIMGVTAEVLNNVAKTDQALAVSTAEGISRMLDKQIFDAANNPQTVYNEAQLHDMLYRKQVMDSIANSLRTGSAPEVYTVAGAQKFAADQIKAKKEAEARRKEAAQVAAQQAEKPSGNPANGSEFPDPIGDVAKKVLSDALSGNTIEGVHVDGKVPAVAELDVETAKMLLDKFKGMASAFVKQGTINQLNYATYLANVRKLEAHLEKIGAQGKDTSSTAATPKAPEPEVSGDADEARQRYIRAAVTKGMFIHAKGSEITLARIHELMSKDISSLNQNSPLVALLKRIEHLKDKSDLKAIVDRVNSINADIRSKTEADTKRRNELSAARKRAIEALDAIRNDNREKGIDHNVASQTPEYKKAYADVMSAEKAYRDFQDSIPNRQKQMEDQLAREEDEMDYEGTQVKPKPSGDADLAPEPQAAKPFESQYDKAKSEAAKHPIDHPANGWRPETTDEQKEWLNSSYTAGDKANIVGVADYLGEARNGLKDGSLTREEALNMGKQAKGLAETLQGWARRIAKERLDKFERETGIKIGQSIPADEVHPVTKKPIKGVPFPESDTSAAESASARPEKPTSRKAVENFKKLIEENLDLQRKKPDRYPEPSAEIAANNIALSADFPSFKKDPNGHHEAMLALKEAAGLPADYQFKSYGNYNSTKDFKARNDVRHWKPSEPIGAENPADVKERERLFREDADRSGEKSTREENLAKSDREIYDDLRAQYKAQWKKGSDKSIADAQKRLKDASDQLEKAQKSGKVAKKQLEKLIESKAKAENELGHLTDPDYKSPADVQFEKMAAAGFGPVRDMDGAFEVTIQTSYINKDKSYKITPSVQGEWVVSKLKYLVSKVTSIDKDGFVRGDKVGWFDTLEDAINATKKTGGELEPTDEPARTGATGEPTGRPDDDGLTISDVKNPYILKPVPGAIPEGQLVEKPTKIKFNTKDKKNRPEYGDIITWHNFGDPKMSDMINGIKATLPDGTEVPFTGQTGGRPGSYDKVAFGIIQIKRGKWQIEWGQAPKNSYAVERIAAGEIGLEGSIVFDPNNNRYYRIRADIDGSKQEQIAKVRHLMQSDVLTPDQIKKIDLEQRKAVNHSEADKAILREIEKHAKEIESMEEDGDLEAVAIEKDAARHTAAGLSTRDAIKEAEGLLGFKLKVTKKQASAQAGGDAEPAKKPVESEISTGGSEYKSGYNGPPVSIGGLTFTKEKISDHYSNTKGEMYVIDLANKIPSKKGDIIQIGIKLISSRDHGEYGDGEVYRSEHRNDDLQVEFREDTGTKRKDGSVMPMWHQSSDIVIPKNITTIEELVSLLRKGVLNEHGPNWNKPNRPGVMAKRFKAFLDLAESYQAKNAPKQQEQQAQERPKQLGAGQGELLDTSEAFNLTGENVAGQQEKPKDTTGEMLAGVDEPAYVSQARAQLAKLEKSGKSPEQQKTLRQTIAAYEETLKVKPDVSKMDGEQIFAELDRMGAEKFSGGMAEMNRVIDRIEQIYPGSRENIMKRAKEQQNDDAAEAIDMYVRSELNSRMRHDRGEPSVESKRQSEYRENASASEVAAAILKHDYFFKQNWKEGQRHSGEELSGIRPTAEIAEEMNVGIKAVSKVYQQLVKEGLLQANKGRRVETAVGSYTTTYVPAEGVTPKRIVDRLRQLASGGEPVAPEMAQQEPLEVKGKKGLAMAINRQKTLISEAPNEATRKLREKDLQRMQDIIDATKTKYTDNTRIETVRRKIKELIDENTFKGRNGGLDFIDLPRVRDLMDRLRGYESKVGTVEQQAEAISKPLHEGEPADITKARKDLSAIIRNMSRGEGWDAKRAEAEAKLEQYEAEHKMLSGEHLPTREQLDIVSNKALEEFVERFGEGEVSPEIYNAVTNEFMRRLDLRERAEAEFGEKGQEVKGDMIGDIADIIKSSNGSIGIPTLPKEFGAAELNALRENLGPALAKKLMRNPTRMGKIDTARAANDKNYRDDVKGAADDMLSELAQALHERGWTQFDPSKVSTDVMKEAILRAAKGETLTPEGGVLGRATKDNAASEGMVERLYKPDESSADDPFSFRDMTPEQAKIELRRRQERNARNKAGDPATRKGYQGIVDRVVSEARLRGELNEKEIEGMTRILNMIGSEFFNGVKFKFGKGEREGEYGQYATASRIVSIFKDAIRSGRFEETAAHEIAHHLTRFLPESDRAAIRAELATKRAEFLKRNKGMERILSTDMKDWAKRRFTAKEVASANLENPTQHLRKLTAEELKKEGFQPDESIYRLKLTDETYRLTNGDEYFAESFKDRVISRLKSDPVYLGRPRNWKERLNGLWETIKINFRKMFGKETADRILSNFAKGRYNPDIETGFSIEHEGFDMSKRDRELKANPVVRGNPDKDLSLPMDRRSATYPMGEEFTREAADGSVEAYNILGRNKASPERMRQIQEFVKSSKIKHALYRGQNGAYETPSTFLSRDGLIHLTDDPDYAAQYAESPGKRVPQEGTKHAIAQVYLNAENVLDLTRFGHTISDKNASARVPELANDIYNQIVKINGGEIPGLHAKILDALKTEFLDHDDGFGTEGLTGGNVWRALIPLEKVVGVFDLGVHAIKYSDSDMRTARGEKRGGKVSYAINDPSRIKAAFGDNDVNPDTGNIFQSKKDKNAEFQFDGDKETLSGSMNLKKRSSITEGEFRQLVESDSTFNPREWERVERTEREVIPPAEEAQRKAGVKPSDSFTERSKTVVEYKRKEPLQVEQEAKQVSDEIEAQKALPDPSEDHSNKPGEQTMKSIRDVSAEQSEDPDVFREPRPGQSVARTGWDVVSGRYFSGVSTKAHQNAERHEYSDTVKQIANMIHTRPGTKSEAFERDMPTAISTTRTKFHNRLNDILMPLRDTLAGFKDTEAGTAREQREKVYEALVDMITGRKQITQGELGKAASKLKGLLAELHEYRAKAGENIGEVQDYYPAVYDSPRIGENRKDFIRDARTAYEITLAEAGEEGQAKALGMTKADFADMSQNDGQALKDALAELAENQAIALYNAHVRGASAEEFDSIFGMADRGAGENPAMSRKFSRSAQDVMRKWQVNDPFRVVGRYITSSAKRAEIVRRFGNEGERWKAMSHKMESDGVPYEIISEMRDLVRKAAGIGSLPLGKASQTYVDTITLMTAASAMGRGFMNNLVEPITIGMRTGSPIDILRAYGETWARFLREIPALSKKLKGKMGETFWAEYGHEIGTIHNTLEDAWMTTHSMELDAEYADPRFRWITNRIYKANLMDASEVAKQQAAHAIGYSYINKLGSMFRGDHWTSRVGLDAKQSVSDQLSELGIKPEDHAAFADFTKRLESAKSDAERKALMLGDGPMAELHREAMTRFSMQSSVRSNRAHKPVFQDTELGKTVLQLMNFSYSYAAEVNSRMYNMSKQAFMASPDGKNYTMYDRLRMMGPAAGGLLSIVAYRGLLELKDLLYPSESSAQRAKDPELVKWANATSYAGLLGPKFEQVMKAVKRDQAPGGPAGQMMVNVGRAAKSTVESMAEGKDMSAAQRSGAKALIPILKGAAVAGSAAVHPALGAVVTQATNSPAFRDALTPDKAGKFDSKELTAKPLNPKK